VLPRERRIKPPNKRVGGLARAGEGYGRPVEDVQPMRLELDNSNLAPREARRALESWLQAVECVDPVAGDALLVVSELVTNVVAHTTSNAVVIATFDDHRLRIEVHDQDPRAPLMVRRAAAGGFGLPIVEALCDAWGWEPTGIGKRVWTERLC
jgi:anti-sigma regulatory factor (Ser/Thr protein kinase)